MLDHARKAVAMAQGRTSADIAEDEMTFFVLSQLLIITGEAASRVHSDVRMLHPTIPWADVIRTGRHQIEGYDEVTPDEVWNAVTKDLPPLIAQLEEIIPPIEEQP